MWDNRYFALFFDRRTPTGAERSGIINMYSLPFKGSPFLREREKEGAPTTAEAIVGALTRIMVERVVL